MSHGIPAWFIKEHGGVGLMLFAVADIKTRNLLMPPLILPMPPMPRMLACLVVGIWPCVALAVDTHTKYDIRWVEENLPKVRQVLEENTQACNAEDVKALMKTLHPKLPGRDEFRAEAEQLFKDTDLYTRIIAVEYSPHLTTTNHTEARFAVYVTQHTGVAKGSEEDKTFFREHAAMIPPEYSRYLMEFLPDGRGGWKCGMIKGKPKEVSQSDLERYSSQDGIPAWFIKEHGGGGRGSGGGRETKAIRSRE